MLCVEKGLRLLNAEIADEAAEFAEKSQRSPRIPESAESIENLLPAPAIPHRLCDLGDGAFADEGGCGRVGNINRDENVFAVREVYDARVICRR